MTHHRWALLSVLALTLAACSSSPSLTQIEVKAAEFTYTPAEIQVQAGQTVELTLTNLGSVEHAFTVLDMPIEEGTVVSTPAGHAVATLVPATTVHVAAAAGESASVVFTPTEPGSYAIECDIPGHRENGMVGTLVVMQP
jgi:uncharacterized cupredoxin-like copper-binding protein